MVAKRIKLTDEHGLTWTFVETDDVFEVLKKLKLDKDEFACFRNHIFLGLLDPGNVNEGEQTLTTLTDRCLEAIGPDDTTLQAFIHAAKAQTTLIEIQRVLEST